MPVAPISAPVPIWLLDRGGLPKSIKWYWHALRTAQILEIDRTFGDVQTLATFKSIDSCTAPGVVIVPVLAGGCVLKRDWLAFKHALSRYRRRGGIVVVLACAFCLGEEGQKARGRHFEGIETSGGQNWLGHPVNFIGHGPLVTSTYGFWTEHNVREDADRRVEVLDNATSGKDSRPLVIRFSETASDTPGCLLFLNTWGWVRDKLEHRPGSDVARHHRASAELTIEALRATNRRAVEEAVIWVQVRLAERVARLEALSGENERLVRNMGAEKDYHRLLANDVPLCIDVVAWQGLLGTHGPSTAFREAFQRGWLWAEPPHHKPAKLKGRLDLLLFPEDQGPDESSLKALEAWLQAEPTVPVAWMELEAGGFNAAQMNAFLDANGHLVRATDFVCAVDRSADDAAPVTAFQARVEALGATFLHTQVPAVFNRLEEHYAPAMHRLSRKRFTTEIIRGLIG